MKKSICIFVSLLWCAYLSGATVQEYYQAARAEAMSGNPEELCQMYLSNDIPKDQEYMYWMIYQTKKQEDWFPSQYALGAAYAEGIPSIKVEQNYSKALYYFQYYSIFRPAGDEESTPDGYWWFENGAVLNKLYGLWSKGYQPCVTNDFPAQLSIVENSAKLLSGKKTIKAASKEMLSFQVENTGKGDADFPLVIVSTSNKNIKIPSVSIPLIKPNETKTVIIPITATQNATAGELVLQIEVREPGTMTSVSTKYQLSIQ